MTPAPQPGLRAYKRTLLGPRSQNRRRTSGWELESQIRRAPGRGETPRPLVWVQLGTALAPSVISLRSTIEVLTSIPREPGSRPPPPFNSAINNSSPSLSVPLSPLRCKLKAGCTPCFYANIRLVWTPAGLPDQSKTFSSTPHVPSCHKNHQGHRCRQLGLLPHCHLSCGAIQSQRAFLQAPRDAF